MSKTVLTEKMIEKQENLSKQRLDNLIPLYDRSHFQNRPQENLIELIHWVSDSFKNCLTKNKTKNLTPFIHNTIVIDGVFMTFAEEKGVKVECLYRDSIASWRSDSDFESFVTQGVFKISHKGCEFIQAALFHKGNQNEDEVSFFVIVDSSSYDKYLLLRNEFEDWVKARDRDNLAIHVVNGEPIPYDRSNSWEDLFMEEDLKNDIKGMVEGFLKSKDFYREKKIPWKRGGLFFGDPGCHAPGTEILMFDGTLKKVEEIVVGDFLMGPDGSSREVLRLISGEEEMFEITPKKGEPFVVNKNHVLHLKNDSNKIGEINISVSSLLNSSKCFQERSKLKLCNKVEFNTEKSDLKIDPYILGVWLGDGTSLKPEITTMDPEIKDAIFEDAKKRNLNVKEYKKTNGKCIKYNLISDEGIKKSNSFINDLRYYNLLGNKHIPKEYLLSSEKDRLQLLAGIVDTDGSYTEVSWRPSEKGNRGKSGKSGSGFEIIQKSERLSKEVVFLARSLGYLVTVRKCTKTIKSIGFSGDYFRINILGDITDIPVRIARKKALGRSSNKNNKNIGIRSITSKGIGPFYGFTLDKDHLYVDGQFFIHHNCGKTSLIRTIISQYDFKPVTVQNSLATNDDVITEAFDYAQSQGPSLLYFEDLDTMLSERVTLSHFLNLMDGVASSDGILVLATANDVGLLKQSVTDRPSRFDRKWEIPSPNQLMAFKYLKKWFGKMIKDELLKEVAKICVNNDFSYSYLKELYITSVYSALATNRTEPRNTDLKKALKQLLNDKKNSLNGFIDQEYEEIGFK